jgi:hypothetical protein
MKTLLLSLTILVFSSSQQLVAQSFHDEVQATYNFTPRKLSKDEQKALFPKLDTFFAKVIQHKELYLEPLRNELKRSDNNPYFYYDGGILLMEISKEKEDLQLVANALVKTDLRDLSHELYLRHLLRLSLSDINVINPALHILDDPTFRVFIAQHALELNQAECLKFILPRYEASAYVPQLIEKYPTIDSLSNKMFLVELLFYSSSCPADDFLLKIKDDAHQPGEVRKFAADLLALKISKRKNDSGKYEQTHQAIKSTLTRISDEAIDELNELTKKLRSFYMCH